MKGVMGANTQGDESKSEIRRRDDLLLLPRGDFIYARISPLRIGQRFLTVFFTILALNFTCHVTPLANYSRKYQMDFYPLFECFNVARMPIFRKMSLGENVRNRKWNKRLSGKNDVGR